VAYANYARREMSLSLITKTGREYDKPMKAKTEYVEGTDAWTRFQAAMKKVIAVPHAEIQRRIEAERSEAAKNPNRRGPKPKKRSAPGPS
jgi:hypothetical protein